MKIQIIGGIVCLRCKGKTLLGLITLSKLFGQKFEFSLKVKVMGSNLGYLLKSFQLYVRVFWGFVECKKILLVVKDNVWQPNEIARYSNSL